MNECVIKSADNGWLVSWLEEMEEADGGVVQRHKVFEIPENFDESKEDPQALIDLLYFVKEEICGQYYSKHKRKNVMIRLEEGEDGRC